MSDSRIIAFVAFLAAVSFPCRGQAVYVNPLQGSTSTHDPVIFKQDSMYYIFHTGNGVSIKTSPDRINWSNGEPSRVIDANPAWHAKYSTSNSLWAPAIAKWGGKYWLYYSMSNFGARTSAIGLRTNVTLKQDDPSYNWVDQGMVVCTYNNATTHPECFFANTTSVNTNDTNAHNAIDPAVILDSAGTPWLLWGSFGAGIKQIRLNPATGKPDSGAPARTIAHRYYTQAPGGSGYYRSIEGAMIHKRGSWYYLFYSHDQCCNGANSTYKIMVTRSASVNGPYVDKDGNLAHPPYVAGTGTVWQTANAGTLVSAGDARWKGTGHNDILVDHDTTFLVNHAYDADNNGATRLMIRPLYWDAQGWPTLDSTKGTINGGLTGLSSREGAVLPKRLESKMKGLWVPWNDGLRDLRGRDVGGER